jgi:hypothetical protein
MADSFVYEGNGIGSFRAVHAAGERGGFILRGARSPDYLCR